MIILIFFFISKLKLIIFLIFLIFIAENLAAKAKKISNWKRFSIEDQVSRQSKMLIGWNGSKLVVNLRPNQEKVVIVWLKEFSLLNIRVLKL